MSSHAKYFCPSLCSKASSFFFHLLGSFGMSVLNMHKLEKIFFFPAKDKSKVVMRLSINSHLMAVQCLDRC